MSENKKTRQQENDDAVVKALDAIANSGAKVVQIGGPDGPSSYEVTLSAGPDGIKMSGPRRGGVDPRIGGCSRGGSGDGRGESGGR